MWVVFYWEAWFCGKKKLAITPSMHFFSCCIWCLWCIPSRHVTVSAYNHSLTSCSGCSEILVVVHDQHSFHMQQITPRGHMTKHPTKNHTFLVDLMCPQYIAKKDVISLWENHSHLSCICIHLLHLRSQNEIWSHPAVLQTLNFREKSWSFCKIPGSTQEEGLFGHHLWTEERHKKY